MFSGAGSCLGRAREQRSPDAHHWEGHFDAGNALGGRYQGSRIIIGFYCDLPGRFELPNLFGICFPHSWTGQIITNYLLIPS